MMHLTKTFLNGIKKTILFALILIPNIANSQTNEEQEESKGSERLPFIEVTGYSEKEIIPDEIFITIRIREKYVNRTKVSIDSQERNLTKALYEIGISLNDISLSEMNAEYITVRWKTKDVIASKEYNLKVNNAALVGLVFQQLDKIEISEAFVSKVNHSKLDSMRQETKIQAIKNAKEKADYLLKAINENTGKPLIVREIESNTSVLDEVYRGYQAKEMYRLTPNFYKDKENIGEVEFKKIKIDSKIFVKFSIK